MDVILLPDETQVNKNYFVNVRKFANGCIEAVVKVVRPLTEDLISSVVDGTSYGAACAEKGESSRSGLTRFSSVEEKSDYEKQVNHARSVRRSKQKIRWICKAMEADRLFTMTYRENIVDRSVVRSHFQEFLRLVRHGFKVKHDDGSYTVYRAIEDWRYVAVLEKQDRGAYHIHCAVKGFQKIKTLRAAWYRAIGGRGDEVGEATPGQVDVTSPDKRWGGRSREWKVNKLAGYLTKYLDKTFDDSMAEKRRYWQSKDVVIPEKRVYWIGGTNCIEAMRECRDFLREQYALKPGFFFWLSPDEDTLFFSGECGEFRIPF